SDSRASHRKDSTPRHGRLLHPCTWAVRDDRGHPADNFFSKEVAQKQATPLTAPATSLTKNRLTPNFRGWGLDENLKLKSPPYRGVKRAGLTRAPPICLSRGGDACVLGAVERVGKALYGARVYVELGRRLAHTHAAPQSRPDSLSQLVRDRRPAKALTF